jgi:hypothetical protein
MGTKYGGVADFEQFWSCYPRRVKKGYARQCYERARKKATHEEIMTGLARFIAAEPWDGRIQFCPHPSSWLNGEQWSDEYDTPGTAIDDALLNAAKRADEEERQNGEQPGSSYHLRVV